MRKVCASNLSAPIMLISMASKRRRSSSWENTYGSADGGGFGSLSGSGEQLAKPRLIA